MSVNIRDDLSALSRHDKKILLLRVLGISEEAIRAVYTGECELGEVLKVRIDAIMSNPDDTSQAAIICQNIRRAGYSFDTLEPDEFLIHAKELKLEQDYEVHTEQVRKDNVKSDNSVLPYPLRRILARIIDLTVGFIIANLLVRPIFGIDPNTAMFKISVLAYLSYAGMLLCEPVFIHFFGTTPGKFIFGIRITYADGSKLSITDGFKRVLKFFIHGLGFLLPLYTLFTTLRTVVYCKKGMVLPWDNGYKLSYNKDNMGLRYVVCIIIFIALSYLDAFFGRAFAIVPNKGYLTKDQFNENCAKVVKYNCLTSDPDMEYKVEVDSLGHVCEVSFSVDTEVSIFSLNPYYTDMFVLFEALVSASDEASFWELNYGKVTDQLSDPESFIFTYAGFEVSNNVTRANSAIKNTYDLLLYSSLDTTATDTKVPYKQEFKIRCIGK